MATAAEEYKSERDRAREAIKELSTDYENVCGQLGDAHSRIHELEKANEKLRESHDLNRMKRKALEILVMAYTEKYDTDEAWDVLHGRVMRREDQRAREEAEFHPEDHKEMWA